MSTISLPPALSADLAEVGQAIARRLSSRPVVEQIAAPYALVAPERRVRAAVVLLAAQCGSYELGRTLHAAAAVELIGAAKGLHVGLIDPSARRRDSVPGWAGLQGNVSLMVGDYLLALAADEMAQSPDQRIISFYSRAVMAFCEGALLGISDSDPPTARAQYLESRGRSAAALLESAARAGAVCGGLAGERLEALGRYGYALGLALQLGDDALDYRDGHGEALRAGLTTLPLIYAAAAGGSQILELLERPPEGAALAEALAEVSRLGMERALADVRGYVGQALAELAALPASPAREALADLARAAAAR